MYKKDFEIYYKLLLLVLIIIIINLCILVQNSNHGFVGQTFARFDTLAINYVLTTRGSDLPQIDRLHNNIVLT